MNATLSFSSEFVEDMSGNAIVAQPSANALQANQIVIDPNPPVLSQFVNFDLDEGTLVLRFTKTILPSSLMSENITLSHTSTLTSNTQLHTLTGGTLIEALGPVITIQLTNVDTKYNQEQHNSLHSFLTCYIRFPEGTVQDLAGNPVVEEQFITSLTAIPQELIPDETGPTVIGFDLDLDSNMLVIEFNEPIQPGFQSSAVTIQNSFMLP